MAPENIKMWLDRARTFMAATVCAHERPRAVPPRSMRVLRPGAYVAPVAQFQGLASALINYAFEERLSDTVLYTDPTISSTIRQSCRRVSGT